MKSSRRLLEAYRRAADESNHSEEKRGKGKRLKGEKGRVLFNQSSNDFILTLFAFSTFTLLTF
jgi:hypothetical protein